MNDICLPPLGLIAVILIAMFVIFGVKNTENTFKNKYDLIFDKKVQETPIESPPSAPPAAPAEPVVEEVEGGEGFGGIEEFNNDLVNPNIDINSTDYEAALKSMALEQSVIDQHQKFNQELMHRTGGTSSRSPVRDDNIDEVPWVGLRRPNYQKINPNDSSARTVPSVKNADDLADYQMISWTKASA